MTSKPLKKKELDQIQQQLQIITATVRSKANKAGTSYQAAYHAFYTSLYNLNPNEIIFRAKFEFQASKRLEIFENAATTFMSIYGHYMDIFGPNPIPEWINQYLSMCEIKDILDISDFNSFISAHLLSGQSLFQANPPSIPELSDADAPEYIRQFAKQKVNDQALVEKVNQLFPPPPPTQPFGLYYPKLADPNTLM